MHNHEHQGGNNEEHSANHENEVKVSRGESSYGWLWIVGIIVLVAVILFFLQDKVPQDANLVEVIEPTQEFSQDPLQAQPTGVYSLRAPNSVAPESLIGIDWVVSTDKENATVEHTYVQWGTDSLAELEFIEEGSYPNSTKSNPVNAQIPANFEANIKVPSSGIVYFRAMAIVDGELYWSPEQSTIIKNK